MLVLADQGGEPLHGELGAGGQGRLQGVESGAGDEATSAEDHETAGQIANFLQADAVLAADVEVRQEAVHLP